MSQPVTLSRSNVVWTQASQIARRVKGGVYAVATSSYESMNDCPKNMGKAKRVMVTIAANAFMGVVYFFCGCSDPDNFLPAPKSRANVYRYTL
ncbi:MAG TPA: hypothetical protein DCY07_01315 [Rhodospirillaceae bacterium]|nr:hypothetical protein [Rhodospirillaceae bacterium]